jgi:hypothetical protein
MTAKPCAPAGTTRYTPHHLPWDRFSKPVRTSIITAKPSITAKNPDLKDLASQTWKHLKDLNTPPFLFRRDGKLCRVEADDTGAPVPVAVDVHRMNFTLVELINWIDIQKTKTEDGEVHEEEVNVRPPGDLARHLVAGSDPPVPTLQRIVTAPVFAATGQLLDKPGEYADGILYLPPKSFRLPQFPPCPSAQDIQSAVDFIEQNLLVDFRFTSEAEKANCFAALLTPLVREMISGPTPLHWVDKWKGGSGGTLLSGVIAVPHLGARPSGVTAPRDEAEWIRVILSTLLRSPNVFFIDNCNAYLSSEALASAITAARYEGRIIGSSHNEAAEVRCLWMINGNNLRFGWELARRVVRIRIDPNEDDHKYVHEDLLPWIIEHRADVIYHLVVLVKAWQAKGCPGPVAGTPEFGSFESWRNVVGGILNTAGIAGFLLNLDDARRDADQESAVMRGFMEAWRAGPGPGPVFATDLLTISRNFFELPAAVHSASIRLGIILSKYESQVHDGWRIQRLPQSQGKTPWQLQAVPAP